MLKFSPLAWTMMALVIFIFVVGLVNFVDGVAAVGSCGVGPAAPIHCN